MSIINQCFEPFKDLHAGMSIAVMGCGPSIDLYDGSKNLIHIGCNELIYSEKFKLDYFFIGDSQAGWRGKEKTFYADPDTYKAYRPRIAKFVRDHPSADVSMLRANAGAPIDHSVHYDICDRVGTLSEFQKSRQMSFQTDIVNNYMYSRMSITWEMLQFALWTGPSKIYLMGQDCSYSKGTLHNPHHKAYGGVPRVPLIQRWQEFSAWVKSSYPETEVFIINPVAMKYFEEKSLDEIVEN